jgi:hypothetical protein
VRFYVQFFQASALDLAHPDNLAIQTLADAFGTVRPKLALRSLLIVGGGQEGSVGAVTLWLL